MCANYEARDPARITAEFHAPCKGGPLKGPTVHVGPDPSDAERSWHTAAGFKRGVQLGRAG